MILDLVTLLPTRVQHLIAMMLMCEPSYSSTCNNTELIAMNLIIFFSTPPLHHSQLWSLWRGGRSNGNWWGGHGSALAVREAFSEVGLIVSGSTRWIAKGILKGCNAWKGS